MGNEIGNGFAVARGDKRLESNGHPLRAAAGLSAGLLILLAILVLRCASAQALEIHKFSSSFGAGQLSSPAGMAINSTTHDVYVADSGNRRIDQFEADGTFVRAWGWGVADGLPAFETCTLSCETGLSGSEPGQFTTPSFVAVDNSGGASEGDVYVGDPADHLVSKFTGEGALVKSWGTNGQLDGSTTTVGGFGLELEGVAVDGSGNLLVLGFEVRPGVDQSPVATFTQAGAFVEEFELQSDTAPAGLAVDSANDLFRVHGIGWGDEDNPAHEEVGLLDHGGEIHEIALGAAGDLYVVESGLVKHYVFSELGRVREAGTSTCPLERRDECPPTDSFGGEVLTGGNGIAVQTSTSDVLVADAATGEIDVFAPAFLPSVSTESASSVGVSSATLNGSVIPEGLELTQCSFEYVDGAGYEAGASDPYAKGASLPCAESAAEIGTGNVPVEVHADLSGLQPGVTYHYRLKVANKEGENLGQDVSFSTPPPPSIHGAEASGLSATSVDLSAAINPGGLPTTYHIEYGTSTSYSTSIPASPEEVAIGAGTTDVQITQHLSGLSANTTYHWRVVAHNEAGTTTGEDHSFVYSTNAQGLPDDRAYELVTPAQKNGAVIGGITFGLRPDIAHDGGRLIMASTQCFAGATSCSGTRDNEGEPFAFTRTSGGWVATPMALPADELGANTSWVVSADSDSAIFSNPSAPGGQDDWILREASGSLKDFGPATEPVLGPLSPEFWNQGNVAVSPDLSKLIWTANVGSSDGKGLWSPDPSNTVSAYEYAGSDNSKPLFVGVSGGEGSTDLISVCGSAVGSTLGNDNLPGSFSADGRTAYFTALACSTGFGANAGVPVPANALYARIDNTEPDAHTIEISRRSSADCVSAACQSSLPGEATFQGASVDGSKAVFIDTQQLTDDAGEDDTPGDNSGEDACKETSGPNGCNLYLYDFDNPAGHELIDVSAGDTSGGGPRVQGTMAISSDGSHIYFVAKGVLTTVPNGQGQSASDGADNLYLYERDAQYPEGRTVYIASLPGSDDQGQSQVAALWADGPLLANVTPDGRYLVFPSSGRLTGDVPNSNGAGQVFRYDSTTGELIRLSLGEHGFNDDGNTSEGGLIGNSTIVYAQSANYHIGSARNDPTMSDDGTRVFFESPAALTPRALNDVQVDPGGDLAQNVYEWEQAGVGSCAAAESSGCVYLISDGRDAAAISSASDVKLLGTDGTGQNVFFTTVDGLVPQDTDEGQQSVYDARVGGGFPYTPEAAPCGESCQGVPAGAPSPQVAGSISFQGPGNISPPSSPAKVKATVLKQAVTGPAFALGVKVPAKGRIVITGTGVKTITRSLPTGGTYRVRLRLTAKQMKTLRRKRHVEVTIKLAFTPSGGAPASMSIKLTVKA